MRKTLGRISRRRFLSKTPHQMMGCFESGAKMIQSKIPAMSVNFIRLSGSDKRVLRDGHWVS